MKRELLTKLEKVASKEIVGADASAVLAEAFLEHLSFRDLNPEIVEAEREWKEKHPADLYAESAWRALNREPSLFERIFGR